MSAGILEAARRLRSAAASGQPCAPVRELIGDDDIQAAYRVQAALIAEQTAAGHRVVGRKIGLTSASVQRQLGVFAPDFGTLLDNMIYADRQPIPLDTLMQPKIEVEVAFVLGSGLDNPRANVADVIRATDFVLPALEVVSSRILNWDIRITDTVADNASSGAVVLGSSPRRLQDVDLVGMGAVLEHLGQPVSTGAGAACLGTPVAAVAWLARALAEQGEALKAGDIILSGALGPMVAVTGPGSYHARLSGLGEVTAVFQRGQES